MIYEILKALILFVVGWTGGYTYRNIKENRGLSVINIEPSRCPECKPPKEENRSWPTVTSRPPLPAIKPPKEEKKD